MNLENIRLSERKRCWTQKNIDDRGPSLCSSETGQTNLYTRNQDSNCP